jgi:hypothetical protein
VGATNGTSNSVESLDVAALGPGAECFCLAAGAAYRYDSGSTQSNIVGTNAFIVPLAGGGCWIKQAAAGAYSTLIQLTANGVGSNFTSSGVWQTLPAVANGYANISINPFFTVNTTTGVITYNGPSGKNFLIMAQLSLGTLTIAGNDINMDCTINGALIGTATLQQSLVDVASAGSGRQALLVQIFQSALANGQTFQHVLLVGGAAATQSLHRYQVSIINVD